MKLLLPSTRANRRGAQVGAICPFALLAAILLLAGCWAVPVPPPVTPTPSPPDTRALFVEPDDGSGPVLQAIRSARRSLDVVVYLLTDRSVIDALIAAHRRGVAVRVMLERDPYGSGPGNAAALEQLRNAGIDVRWGNPAFALTHQKALVVDGGTALIMTLNLTYSAFHGNREYGIITRDAAEVNEVLAGFNADWERRAFEPRTPSLLWSDANTRRKLLAAIDGARSSLLLEQASLQDRELLQRLAGAARRGVELRIITPPDNGNSDPNRPGREQLLAAGAQVRTLQDPVVHAKIVVADGTSAIVGSANLTFSGMENNRELGIRVVEPDIIGRLVETFEADWARAAPYR